MDQVLLEAQLLQGHQELPRIGGEVEGEGGELRGRRVKGEGGESRGRDESSGGGEGEERDSQEVLSVLGNQCFLVLHHFLFLPFLQVCQWNLVGLCLPLVLEAPPALVALLGQPVPAIEQLIKTKRADKIGAISLTMSPGLPRGPWRPGEPVGP